MAATREEIAVMQHKLRTSARISAMFDRPLPRIMPRYYMVRLYIALSILTNSLVGFFEPMSPGAWVLRSSHAGWLWLSALFAMGLFSLADVIVNDLMPERYSLDALRNQRHTGYSAVAMATLGLSYVVLHEYGYTAQLLTYWVDAAFALSVAYLDLRARHRGIA